VDRSADAHVLYLILVDEAVGPILLVPLLVLSLEDELPLLALVGLDGAS
jgi:hypothetical protein